MPLPVREAGSPDSIRHPGERPSIRSDTGRAFVTLHYAQSIDGRIATAGGSAEWLSSGKGREIQHRLRSEHDAVMVGVGTIIADDPQLTVRAAEGRNPIRIVLDSKLRIPHGSKVLSDEAKTIVATTWRAAPDRVRQLEDSGAIVVVTQPDVSDRIDIASLLALLRSAGIGRVMVEGGGELITSLLRARMVDELIVSISPRILGRGVEAIGDLGIVSLKKSITFTDIEFSRAESDLIFRATPVWS